MCEGLDELRPGGKEDQVLYHSDLRCIAVRARLQRRDRRRALGRYIIDVAEDPTGREPSGRNCIMQPAFQWALMRCCDVLVRLHVDELLQQAGRPISLPIVLRISFKQLKQQGTTTAEAKQQQQN